MIKTLSNLEEFNNVIKEQTEELYLMFYTASWCGPCKFIYPLIERLDVQIKGISIYKIDVDNDNINTDDDKNSKISVVNDVDCMPTFHLYKKGKIISKIIGANKIKLLKEIKIYLEN